MKAVANQGETYLSKPLLPARPEHCLKFKAVKCIESPANTQDLAGALIPSANVPVDITTLSTPLLNKFSTSVLYLLFNPE